MKYWAFLSYSHTDKKWADWLHKALETYRVPHRLVGKESRDGSVPPRVFPIFRDREELPVSADLGSNINEALQESRYLIVICSPRAAQSRWVAEEIKTFKKLGRGHPVLARSRENRILALIVDGEPNASDGKPGFAIEDECFPAPMRYRLAENSELSQERTEPIAADARESGDGKNNAKLKLLAGLLGVNYDGLKRRDQDRRLRRARTIGAAALVLVLIFAALSVALFYKEREAQQARIEEAKQHTLAQEQSEQRRQLLVEAARSDRLVAEEKLERGESPAAFAYLARSIIYDGTSTFAAEKAIAALNTWCFGTPVSFCGKGNDPQRAQFSPDGERVVVAYGDNTARVWEVKSGKLLNTLKGHEDIVSSARFSPDGRRIVTGSADKTARVWEVQSGKLLATLQGHEGRLNSAEFSPDGQRIVTTSDDKTARVWEAKSGKLLATLQGHENQVSSAQFSPDGQRIVTGSDDETARVWEAQSGRLLTTLQGHSAQFSPEGQRIVTASRDKTARVWEAKSGKLMTILKGHEDALWSAGFSPDGQLIVTCSQDETARMWEAKSGKLLTTLHGVFNPAFSPNGERIVTACPKYAADQTPRVWEARSGKLLITLQRHESWVNNAQFSPDGHRILTEDNETVRVWEAQSDHLVTTLQSEAQGLNAQFSPDGKRIATIVGDFDARIWEARVWDFESGKLLLTLKGHQGPLYSVQFSPDGELIVTASEDETARVWEAHSGKLLTTLQGHQGRVYDAQFSADGDRIVTASQDKTARVWQAHSGKLLVTLQGHENQVFSAEFSPDGRRVVTASQDKTVRLWEAQTGKLLATLRAHENGVTSAQFSPDSQRIVSTSYQRNDTGARLWDAPSGKLVATLQGQDSAQFSPDGQRIVTTDGKSARIWESQSGKLVATLQGQDSAQFSPDGESIVTASEDKTARVWTILPPSAGAPPPWFPDFLQYKAQQRLNSDGELEPIPPADWLALRDRLRKVVREAASQDTLYLRILRRFIRE